MGAAPPRTSHALPSLVPSQNLVDNKNLDSMGFSPFAKVIAGMDVVDELYSGYGEGGAGDGSDGRGPSQARVQVRRQRCARPLRPQLRR